MSNRSGGSRNSSRSSSRNASKYELAALAASTPPEEFRGPGERQPLVSSEENETDMMDDCLPPPRVPSTLPSPVGPPASSKPTTPVSPASVPPTPQTPVTPVISAPVTPSAIANHDGPSALDLAAVVQRGAVRLAHASTMTNSDSCHDWTGGPFKNSSSFSYSYISIPRRCQSH